MLPFQSTLGLFLSCQGVVPTLFHYLGHSMLLKVECNKPIFNKFIKRIKFLVSCTYYLKTNLIQAEERLDYVTHCCTQFSYLSSYSMLQSVLVYVTLVTASNMSPRPFSNRASIVKSCSQTTKLP